MSETQGRNAGQLRAKVDCKRPENLRLGEISLNQGEGRQIFAAASQITTRRIRTRSVPIRGEVICVGEQIG